MKQVSNTKTLTTVLLYWNHCGLVHLWDKKEIDVSPKRRIGQLQIVLGQFHKHFTLVNYDRR
jgi:hypothetical protein